MALTCGDLIKRGRALYGEQTALIFEDGASPSPNSRPAWRGWPTRCSAKACASRTGSRCWRAIAANTSNASAPAKSRVSSPSISTAGWPSRSCRDLPGLPAQRLDLCGRVCRAGAAPSPRKCRAFAFASRLEPDKGVSQATSNCSKPRAPTCRPSRPSRATPPTLCIPAAPPAGRKA